MTNFSCYECVENQCDVSDRNISLCETAISCWKSSFRVSQSIVRYSRGCISSPDDYESICNNNITQASIAKDIFTCCPTELCNDGGFAVLTQTRFYVWYTDERRFRANMLKRQEERMRMEANAAEQQQ
ncbi:uncharacterized protein LOC131666566 [Phymastichus coffea]|uniref:uncharacterized protein LOC131666566 n=1 Tax=Phymastichus coffea TaxID=108790 RepID=UPI00273BF5D2|nr:uncharacterized protein LOC131666566 [Phymastichus coffea]